MIVGGLLALVIVAAVVAVFAAESIVNGKKDEILADVSQQIGRPVRAGKISISLLRGEVGVADVTIGRDPTIPEEPDPALSLGLARIAVPLWPVIVNRGMNTHVKEITVERFSAAVVRLRDGTLNWQRVAERLDDGKKKESEPLTEDVRQIVRTAVIDQLRASDIAVRFVDLENQGATVGINDFDLAMDDVSLLKAFTLKIAAGILAEQQNFTLDAAFGPSEDVLGEISPPRLDRASIKLAPTKLAPLAPFLAALGKSPGIKEVTDGLLAIDLGLNAGAAVPGGQGPTTMKGFVALNGLKFEGGQAFDARLDSDITSAVDEGSVDIKKLSMRLGDMGIDVLGQLRNLTAGGSPEVAGFSVQSQGLDFTKLHAFYPALDKTAGVILRGPFSLNARGSADEGQQRVIAKLDLTPAAIEVPAQFKKPSGTALVFETQVAAKPNLIDVQSATLTMAKLVLKATAVLRTQGTGKAARQSFEATADIPPVAVRDLVALVAPKELASVPPAKFGARIEASGTVGRDETMKVKVPSFSVASGKSDLQGSLSFENLKAPKVAFEGRSKYLDVDDFMPPSAKTAGKAGKADAEAAKPGAAAEEPPPQLSALTGDVKLTVDAGRAAEIDYKALKADLGVKNGRLAARALEVDTLGGHFSGAGTEFPIADPKSGFVARGEVAGLDVATVLEKFANKRNLINGKLYGKLDLSGPSTLPEDIRKTLSGRIGGRVENAELLTTSILAPIVDALEKASGAPLLSNAISSAKQRVAALKDRRLGKLGGALRFAEGIVELTNPLDADTPTGPLSVDGRVTLAGEADMTGKLMLKPEIATAITGGKAKFDGPVPIGLRIDGPIGSPRIRPADPVALGKVFLTAFAKGEAGRLLSDKAKEVLENPAVVKAREDAERAKARANAETEKARAEATAQTARAQEEARVRSEAARQEAEARAQKAKDDAAQKAKEAASKGLRGVFGR
jgi:AsmA protein